MRFTLQREAFLKPLAQVVNVVDLDSQECVDLLGGFIAQHPEIWNEDIGE